MRLMYMIIEYQPYVEQQVRLKVLFIHINIANDQIGRAVSGFQIICNQFPQLFGKYSIFVNFLIFMKYSIYFTQFCEKEWKISRHHEDSHRCYCETGKKLTLFCFKRGKNWNFWPIYLPLYFDQHCQCINMQLYSNFMVILE